MLQPTTSSASWPYPPFELATRTLSLQAAPDPQQEYEALGRETREHLLDLLPDDWSFEGKRRRATVFDAPPLPTSKEQCKRGGRATFGFANQGQCITFVSHP